MRTLQPDAKQSPSRKNTRDRLHIPPALAISQIKRASDLDGRFIEVILWNDFILWLTDERCQALVNFRWRIQENPQKAGEKMLKLKLADLTRPNAAPSSVSFYLFGAWAEACSFLYGFLLN